MEPELLTERLTTSADARLRESTAPSDTCLRCLGPRADLLTAAFGEAGLWVTVVSLPARGRPEAARRAGLEVVEKLLTSKASKGLPIRATRVASISVLS
jgi:hypothetical protein